MVLSSVIDKRLVSSPVVLPIQEAFGQNAVRLEERLARLGLLKRLSDACAYVQNPYALEQNRASN